MHVEEMRRRADDGRYMVKMAERVLLWGAVLGLCSTVAVFYTRVKDTIPKTEALEEKVRELDTNRLVAQAATDQRWSDLFNRLDRIERRLDRRDPR